MQVMRLILCVISYERFVVSDKSLNLRAKSLTKNFHNPAQLMKQSISGLSTQKRQSCCDTVLVQQWG
jgi:hypothetical protein